MADNDINNKKKNTSLPNNSTSPENNDNNLKAGVVNLAQAGGKKVLDRGVQEATQSLTNSETDDATTDETVQNLNRGISDFKAAKSGYANVRKLRDDMGKAGSGSQTVSATSPTSATKRSVGETAKKSLVTAFKSLGKAFLGAIKTFFCTPMGWIVIGVLVLCLVMLLIFAYQHNVKETNIHEGNYRVNDKKSETEAIDQTWTGTFYQKYANMSIYAQVDTSGISKGNSDICPDDGNGSMPSIVGGDTGVDACSGETFQELSGTDIGSIEQNRLYQEGTDAWASLNVQDADHKEQYLGLSAGALSILDKGLNGDTVNPGQFIKPVYADCMSNFDEFVKDQANDFDKDGQVTVKDCSIRKYGDDGKAQNITNLGEMAHQSDDPTLYLSYADSTAFKDDGGNNSGASIEEGKKERGQWDYGLGTLAHYVAVYQPSRVTNYNVDSIQYVCDGDGTAGGVAVSACSGAKFGDVVVDEDPSHSGAIDSATMTQVYKDAYAPDSDLYYREWHKDAQKFAEKSGGQGLAYGGGGGEYASADIPREDWVYEPAISTGVPQTEVKYVIDRAVTYAGIVDFDIKQDWVTETTAEHTQYVNYATEKNNLASAEEPFPSIGSNTGAVQNYSLNRCLYYGGTKKACGFTEGDMLKWVEEGVRTYKDSDAPEEEPIKVPAHYEDLEGNMYKNGAIVGNYTSTPAKKAMGLLSDDRGGYQWGATVSATVSIHKKGDLQTYAVKYTSTSPTTKDSTHTTYLTQYLHNYESYITDSHDVDETWECTGSTFDKKDADDYAKAKDARPDGKSLGDFDVDKTSHLTDRKDAFCYKKGSSETSSEFIFDQLPALQYNSMAGRMGFTLENFERSKNDDIEPEANTLKTMAGGAKDNQLITTLAKTDPYGQSVSDIVNNLTGQYGVDGSLLALIIAEEDSDNGNITGVSPGEYTAYNMSSRARTTEHFGGSSKSSDTQSLGDVVMNFVKNLFSSSKNSIAIGKNAKETITVTEQQLEDGGMLVDNGTGHITTENYDAFSAAQITNQDSLKNAQVIYSIFSKKGYSDVAIAGMLGNLQKESSINFTIVEGGKFKGDVMSYSDLDKYTKDVVWPSYDGSGIKINKKGYYSPSAKKYLPGIGIVQWTAERAYNLIEYAKAQGGDWTNPTIQTNYFLQEVENYSKGHPAAYSAWMNAKSVEEATEKWYLFFESGGFAPSDRERKDRGGFAQTYYQKITTGEIRAYEPSAGGTSSHITNTDVQDIINVTDNEGYRWDPTDPLYGQVPTAGGKELLEAVKEDEEGKIISLDIYPSVMKDDGSISEGVIVAHTEKGDRIIAVSSGIVKDRPFGYKPGTYTIDKMENGWQSLYEDEWTPMSITVYGEVVIQSVPYTSQSRDSLKEGAYQKLIDHAPDSKGGFRVCLKDLIWLYDHIDKGKTEAIIHAVPFDGEVPEVQKEADEDSVTVHGSGNTSQSGQKPQNGQGGNIMNGTASVGSTNVSIYSGASLSTKIAAMKLQGLQVKYDYNIPMILTAYGLGEDYMDAVLECYEQESGVSAESAIDDPKDTAWADYRKYVYENPEEFDIKVSSGRPYDYAEKVLSRMNGNKIYYQKIDLRYDREKDMIKENENAESDASQHTIAAWSVHDLHDSLADANATKSKANAAHVLRAWKSLTKESGNDNLSEDQWKELTGGAISYPDDRYDTTDTESYYEDGVGFIKICPEVDISVVNDLISDMMRFGTDETYAETDYTNNEFAAARISKLLGNAGSNWRSTISPDKLFGKPDDGPAISMRSLTDDGNSVIRRFGYRTDEYGDREYRPYTTYQDLSKKSGNVYTPFDGAVSDVGENKELGKYVKVHIDAPNKRDDLYVILGNLKETTVSEGDTANGKVGASDDKGVFYVSFLAGSDYADYEEIYQSVSASVPELGDDAFGAGTSGIGGAVGGGSAVTNSGVPNVNVSLLLGITWKDLLGPNAPHTPSQYAGHQTWSPSGLMMNAGYGGDLAMSEGTPVLAPVDGWIASCDDVNGRQGGKTNRVTFAWKGEDGFIYTIYVVHIENNSCSAAASQNGGVVHKGDVIARVGTTGNSTGPHAHVYGNRMGSNYDPSSDSTRLTRVGCTGNMQEPCGVKLNPLLNW